jgi:hypothetical protein
MKALSNIIQTSQKVTYWRPNPGPQTFLLSLPFHVYEMLYGGARGGGKTDAGIVWIGEHQANPNYRGLVIRRNNNDLEDWVDRARKMYPHAQVAYRPAVITFPSGAIIRTGHLKDSDAYTKYMGHEYQRMLIEELTQIPSEKRYLQLTASCRSTVPGIPAQIMGTTNPGGVGHAWVKERFIDFSTPMKAKPDPSSGRLRIFVPAKVDDNPPLTEADPAYVRTLEALKETDEDLWKAWRLGDWNIFAGQVFREFSQANVTARFDWPLDVCRKFITFDWGYKDPGVALWMALSPENKYGIRRMFCYRELTQTGKNPEEWANDLRIINSVDPVNHIILPHDCFNKESGDSIADIFARVGKLRVMPGRTLERGARLNRLHLTHRWLGNADDGRPYLLIHPDCRETVKTLPQLVYSETNPEDVDTDGPDHHYDALSMGLLMEAPVFGDSGGVKPRTLEAAQPRTWVGDNQGNLDAPDFWTAFKEGERPTKWHK